MHKPQPDTPQVPSLGCPQVTPQQVVELLRQGHLYIDVRSEPEFSSGHVPGAYNVPLAHAHAAGFTPNPDFLVVMQRHFSPAQALILGCKAGARSAQAAVQLAAAGYSALQEMSLGWYGQRDAFGQLTPGWSLLDLPIETVCPAGHSYSELRGA